MSYANNSDIMDQQCDVIKSGHIFDEPVSIYNQTIRFKEHLENKKTCFLSEDNDDVVNVDVTGWKAQSRDRTP